MALSTLLSSKFEFIARGDKLIRSIIDNTKIGDSIRMINKFIRYLIRVRMLGVNVSRKNSINNPIGIEKYIEKTTHNDCVVMKNLCPYGLA
jgi:hypothetical protein